MKAKLFTILTHIQSAGCVLEPKLIPPEHFDHVTMPPVTRLNYTFSRILHFHAPPHQHASCQNTLLVTGVCVCVCVRVCVSEWVCVCVCVVDVVSFPLTILTGPFVIRLDRRKSSWPVLRKKGKESRGQAYMSNSSVTMSDISTRRSCPLQGWSKCQVVSEGSSLKPGRDKAPRERWWNTADNISQCKLSLSQRCFLRIVLNWHIGFSAFFKKHLLPPGVILKRMLCYIK